MKQTAEHEQMVLAAITALGGSPTPAQVVDYLCPPVPIEREQARRAIGALLLSQRADLDFDRRLHIRKDAS